MSSYHQVRSVVQSSARGLRETVNLDQRLQLLRKSRAKDRQCITTSLLAKTLAFRGEMEGAKEEMRRWREFTRLGGREEEKKVERRRWREASTKLNLFLCRRKNALADLRKEDWKKAKQEGASPQDIKDFVQQALKVSKKGIFLFDSQDEEQHRPELASWTPGGWSNL